MSENARILEVPRCINPIVDVHDQPVVDDPYDHKTFFAGYAPAETPVRMVHCPECGVPVSAAHLHLHRQTHETAKQEPARANEHFHIPSESRLAPLTPCAYAERQAYTFRMLFERDGK